MSNTQYPEFRQTQQSLPGNPFQNAPAGSPFGSAPQAPQRSGGAFRVRRGLAGIVAVALLSAGIGGAAGLTADHYLNDEPMAAVATDTNNGAQTNSTQVVQANSQAPDWEATAKAVSPAVVAIQVRTAQGAGQGSGVIISTDGTIVTNNHVVGGNGAQIRVVVNDKAYDAKIVGTDPSTDLAVIRLVDPPKDLKTVDFGDSSQLSVGQPVMAVGNPLGLSDTATTGIISALNRPVTTKAETSSGDTGNGAVVTSAIQTNAAINPGNSGGALVDSSGKLIGITSSIASMPSASGGQSGSIGIGFAIPVSQVKDVVSQLEHNGTVQHPQLGVNATDADQQGQLGAQISGVVSGSAAADAGLRDGDIITAVNGAPISSAEALVAQIRTASVGSKVMITFVRDGQSQQAAAVLAAAAN